MDLCTNLRGSGIVDLGCTDTLCGNAWLRSYLDVLGPDGQGGEATQVPRLCLEMAVFYMHCINWTCLFLWLDGHAFSEAGHNPTPAYHP